MGRELASLTAAAAEAPVARPVFLVRLDFASGIVRAASTPFDIEWDGETYLGLGTLGAISAVQEGAELQGYAVALTLSGIPSDLVALALNDQYQGRDARVWLGLLDDQHQLVGVPLLLFRGRMDTVDMELGQTASITLTIQSCLADWERPRLRRYSSEDQKSEYPDDRGLEYISQMAEKTIYWGRPS